MKFENIKWEREGKIGVITLNRPRSLNALSVELFEELETVLAEIDESDAIGAYIITGAPRPDGRPCFCAGADLKQVTVEERSPEQVVFDTLYAMTTGKSATGLAGSKIALEDLGKSTKVSIAAIDGVCTAGGLELALGCDIILASETAQISDLHVRNLGLIGGAASTSRLAWRVGASKAIELCCTCDVIDGKEAHRIGLANQVYAPDKLIEEAKNMANKIASMRPSAVAMAKATCYAIKDMDYNMSTRFTDACSMAIHFGEQEWREQMQDPNAKKWK
ncbi:MAG: enoyl-CoA hydratase/isomerase family protein [Deltaproteobacteria bacterium]|nr:enoyl-CoA hydratase/isomerase family protein [Deltaproteobacteria bacterium]